MDIIQIGGPEIPDPTQLDLFAAPTSSDETVNCSPDSATQEQVNEVLIRSPTARETVYSENGKYSELTDSQKQIASSLLRKSRELVSKSIELRKQEDPANTPNTPPK